MLFDRFVHYPPGNDEVRRLIEDYPAMRPSITQYMTTVAYQTEYGIYPYHQRTGLGRPLAALAMHDKENVMEGGPEFSYIRRFNLYRVSYYFGLGLTEFFDLPCYQADLVLDIARMEMTQHGRAQETLGKQLQNDLDQ